MARQIPPPSKFKPKWTPEQLVILKNEARQIATRFAAVEHSEPFGWTKTLSYHLVAGDRQAVEALLEREGVHDHPEYSLLLDYFDFVHECLLSEGFECILRHALLMYYEKCDARFGRKVTAAVRALEEYLVGELMPLFYNIATTPPHQKILSEIISSFVVGDFFKRKEDEKHPYMKRPSRRLLLYRLLVRP